MIHMTNRVYLQMCNRHLTPEQKISRRIERRLRGVHGCWAVSVASVQGQSIAITVHTRNGDDFSPLRIIGIYSGGKIQQRIGGVHIGGKYRHDPQSSCAELNRFHADNIQLAADCRRNGMNQLAREAITRAAHWRSTYDNHGEES